MYLSEDDEAKGSLIPELSFNVSFNSASKLNESWNRPRLRGQVRGPRNEILEPRASILDPACAKRSAQGIFFIEIFRPGG
jgi:hypothetical protein